MLSHPRYSPRLVHWFLIGCCIGTIAFAGACSSSEATRTEGSAAIALRDTTAVEATERLPEPVLLPAPKETAVVRLIEDALRTGGGISRPELMRRLGLPRRTTVESIRNRYELERTDTVHTLVYPGLQAVLYEVTQTERTFLIRLVLTSARYHSPEGLHVGMPQTQVLDRIGPPTEHDSLRGELIYAETESMPTALILTVRRGHVTRIAWEFYFS